jgi:hypothetical protein
VSWCPEVLKENNVKQETFSYENLFRSKSVLGERDRRISVQGQPEKKITGPKFHNQVRHVPPHLEFKQEMEVGRSIAQCQPRQKCKTLPEKHPRKIQQKNVKTVVNIMH